MSVEKNSASQALDSANGYLARIRELIERNCLLQARSLLLEALEHHPRDPAILAFQEVLKPPRGRPRPILDADRSREYDWIASNRDSYRGRWVAVMGDRLVADASTFAELQSRIKNLESTPLVHRLD